MTIHTRWDEVTSQQGDHNKLKGNISEQETFQGSYKIVTTVNKENLNKLLVWSLKQQKFQYIQPAKTQDSNG